MSTDDGVPVRCRCGLPARGDMSATSAATGSLVHWCRQCSVEHCELDRYLTGGRAGQRITGTVRYIPGP